MSKILHLFSIKDSIYTETFFHFVEDNFDSGEHEFAVLTSDKKTKESKMEYYNPSSVKDNFRLSGKINQSRVTILHGIFFTSILTLILNMTVKKEKVVWMIWGGDLYNWKSRSENVLSRISDCNQRMLRKKMSGVVVSFLPDENMFQREFGQKAKAFYAHYPIGYTKEQLDRNKVDKAGKTVHFLIGNSANPCLNHIKVLESLERFKDQDICIHLPLNYGDHLYGDQVAGYARKSFGSKALCYRERMGIEDYIRLLWQTDVGIFDTDRQIALGNIIMLCYMGKKLYFRKNTPLAEYFEKMKICPGDISILKEQSIDTVCENFSQDTEYTLSLEYLEQEKIRSQWNSVFQMFSSVN